MLLLVCGLDKRLIQLLGRLTEWGGWTDYKTNSEKFSCSAAYSSAPPRPVDIAMPTGHLTTPCRKTFLL
jgi:hypothetical protein